MGQTCFGGTTSVTLALMVCLLSLLYLCVVHDPYNDDKVLIFEDIVPLTIIEF